MGTGSHGGPGAPEDFAEIVKDLTVDDIVREIDQAEEGNEREALKAQIRAAELAVGEPRQDVLDATEPVAVTPPPPPPGPGDPPVEDTSGRPDLAEVAEKRAANRNVRVIGAQEG